MAKAAIGGATPLPGFCRDCFSPVGPKTARCATCGSPRLIRHPELFRLGIAHLDCDAFYAAIEKRDDPSLADKPLIIGGGKRGVVSTACYIARTYGVRSAMPMFQALKACPEAVVLPPAMDKYAAVGRQVRALMLALTPLVEPLSIDEAFLDLSGTERLHGAPPAITLARLARRIETELGITVSIGLSFGKFLAKVASDLEKPRGLSVIGRAEAIAFLSDKPVSLIWGVGKAMQARLAEDGIRTVGALQRMDEKELVRRYGAIGLRLAQLSRAEDDRAVDPSGEMKSISAETTFDSDLADGHGSRVEGDPPRLVGARVPPAEESRAGRPYRHPQAQDRGFPPAHAQPAPLRSDPARGPHLRRRRRLARPRDRRDPVSPDRHRSG
jgi:DNA polymerase-4